MAWLGWKPEMPVIVLGVRNGEITSDGSGSQEFESLEHVRQTFADVDPEVNGQRFTWAQGGETREGRPQMQFMTWKAYEIYVPPVRFFTLRRACSS